jgi:pyruvate dehydrogenase E1 component
MVPVYVFYSMFGFQRTADFIWAAADQLARGFLIGATAGKTTLTGEGTQHMDGHSPLLALSNPAVCTYDPAYAYEMAHIMQYGLERMYGDNPENVIFYMTVYNEPKAQPAEPENVDVEGIRKGMYLLKEGSSEGLGANAPRAQLMASGVGVPWVLEAQELLRKDFGIVADVWSVTSWNELGRDAIATEKANYNDGGDRVPFVTAKLTGRPGVVVAVSDYATEVQNQIANYVPGSFRALGADGFGFSDTRAAARRFLKIDGPSIVVAVLRELAEVGDVPRELGNEAYAKYQIDNVTAGSSGSVGGDA